MVRCNMCDDSKVLLNNTSKLDLILDIARDTESLYLCSTSRASHVASKQLVSVLEMQLMKRCEICPP